MSMPRIFVVILAGIVALAQIPSSAAQASRQPVITAPIDNGAVVVVPGSKHPLAQPRFDIGAVDANKRLTRVLLVLAPAPEQQQQVQAFLDRQQDKRSPDYHHWLTPEEFAQRFGPAPQDLQTVQSWLTQQGIEVTSVAKSGQWMELSGTTAQMERVFRTQMRQYQIAGEKHVANATEISIPQALAPVVRGIVSLHDFFKKPMLSRYTQARVNSDGTYSPITPDVTLSTTNGPVHALAPADYAKIYDLNRLYNATPTPLNGSGVLIGIVARNDISIFDFNNFRSITNLPPGNIVNVLTLDPDPGFDPNSGDTVEATLDAQWAGAVAPNAGIKVVVSASTATTDGVDLSSAYIVDHNLTDIMNVSFGECEASMGAAENAFYNSLWQQAAAQGISVFVSTGDSGAAGCDRTSSATAARGGLAVSGLSTTPFNTAVGGTQFNEGGNDATFWSVTNGTGLVSVQGYIPEVVWNQSCDPTLAGSPCAGQGFFLVGGGGGASILYPKPEWQSGLFGIPNDSARDVPDVSLSAATHDGYIICFNNSCNAGQVFIIGGTSASSPSFAGIMAIVDQTLGRQGLANYMLYRLATVTSARCSSNSRTNPSAPPPTGCIFNDVTAGNNSVPGLTGFSATTDFDLATGLGSVNAANLVTAWGAVSKGATTTTLTSNGGTTVTGTHGQLVALEIVVTGPNAPGPGGTASLSASTAGPVGAVTLIARPSNVGTFNGAVSNLPGGTYSLTAHYPGDGQVGPSDSNSISVTISPETSTAAFRAFGITPQGFPVQTTTFPYGSFMDLHVDVAGASGQGIATGIVSFQDITTALGVGSARLNLKAEAELFFVPGTIPTPLTVGPHTLTASYLGDSSFGVGVSAPLTVTITKGNPTVAIVPTGSNFVAGQAGTLGAAVKPSGTIVPTGTIQFLDGGVPLGAAVTLAPGQTQAVLTTTFPNEGTHSITASYSGDATYNAAVSSAASVIIAPPFGMAGATPNSSSATVVAGQTATYNLVAVGVSANGPTNFSGTVALTCSGAPAGTTCSINPASVVLSPAIVSVPFTVTVTTTTSAALQKLPFRGLPVVFAAIFALAISVKGSRRRLWQAGLAGVLVLGISSCGGGGPPPTPPPPPPPPVTHATLVVTGTSGTHVTTLNLSLTITH
jgi:hypothetical protein